MLQNILCIMISKSLTTDSVLTVSPYPLAWIAVVIPFPASCSALSEVMLLFQTGNTCFNKI